MSRNVIDVEDYDDVIEELTTGEGFPAEEGEGEGEGEGESSTGPAAKRARVG